MEHVVFFPAPDGTPVFRRFAGLDEAVRFVEHLRNVENLSSASVYSLTEVPLAFKAWYRVEVPGEAVEQAPTPAPVAVDAAPVAVPAAAAAAAPATIAEAIESYSQDTAPVPTVEVPERASTTGIVVPDQPLIAVDQFALSAPTVLPVPERPEVATVATPAVVADETDAQVLEPAFGARRERGIGFFAR